MQIQYWTNKKKYIIKEETQYGGVAQTTFHLNSFDENQVYFFQVKAFNKEHDGPLSDILKLDLTKHGKNCMNFWTLSNFSNYIYTYETNNFIYYNNY